MILAIVFICTPTCFPKGLWPRKFLDHTHAISLGALALTHGSWLRKILGHACVVIGFWRCSEEAFDQASCREILSITSSDSLGHACVGRRCVWAWSSTKAPNRPSKLFGWDKLSSSPVDERKSQQWDVLLKFVHCRDQFAGQEKSHFAEWISNPSTSHN